MSSISSGGFGLRPFVVAEYSDGRLASTILDCPFGGPDETCLIAVHDHRVRKTGPKHPLAVLRCRVHDRSFTAYPPGFMPYARRGLDHEPAQHGVPAVFEVVERVAVDGPWQREDRGSPAGSRSTAGRLLDRAARVFGLDDIDDMAHAATAFGIPLAGLHQASQVQGSQARAVALLRLRQDLSADDLLALGALTGCWGRPHRWHADRDQLVAMPLSRGPPMKSGR